jgi:hypothetical protein
MSYKVLLTLSKLVDEEDEVDARLNGLNPSGFVTSLSISQSNIQAYVSNVLFRWHLKAKWLTSSIDIP